MTTPSKSMLQKSNHDFKEKYPYVYVGTIVSMRIIDSLTKTVFCRIGQCFRIRK